jgi:dihydrofolate synthase/folylpolyglutamate synthase
MSFQTGDGPIYERLSALHPKRIDLTLGRLQGLLEKLDHPEQKIPAVIHIAGTNGKGSTAAFCRAFFEAAGKSVHVYTSPHLVKFNERIRLGGSLVDDARLAEALEHCERVNAGAPITFFEITTAAALWLFANTPADYTLLEVGMGGRFDATNVIGNPALTVITPISIDHEDYLGPDLKSIAGEKAGILKRNVPCVVAAQADEAMAEIQKTARAQRAVLTCEDEQWSVSEERGRLVYHDDHGLLDLPAPRLAGRHQFQNAGVAIATMRVLNTDFPQTAFEQGMRAAQWPARLQLLNAGPLVNRAPKQAEIWLDGGHNAAAAGVIAAAMAELEEKKPRPLILIAGMLSTKHADDFFRPFAGLVAKVFTLAVPEAEAPYDAETLAKIAAREGLDAVPMPDLATALSATAAIDKAPRILICGSLYLAGFVLKQNGAALN